MAMLLSAVCFAAVWCFYRWYYMRNRWNGWTAQEKDVSTQPIDYPDHTSSGLDGSSVVSAANSIHTNCTLAKDGCAGQNSEEICSVASGSPITKKTRHKLAFMGGIGRLFHRRKRSESARGSAHVDCTQSISSPDSSRTEAQQPAAPGLTIAKRGQSLRGCSVALKGARTTAQEHSSPSTVESSSSPTHLTASESNFYDVPEHPDSDNGSTYSTTDGDIFSVLYPYSPIESDELAITPGEKIRILRVFSDGWAFVQRVADSKIGAIPAVCLDSSF
ncbi:hypothetical protein GGF43_005195 [Coemansia sp. RSA 2618]|nr:hypothetical protein GGF43_005195 [Coemansia sp. RSA 2618]